MAAEGVVKVAMPFLLLCLPTILLAQSDTQPFPSEAFAPSPPAPVWSAAPAGSEDVTVEEYENQQEENKEEAEEFSPEGVGVAFTLLGSLGFTMTLMYLVNWLDDDIRRYSWLVISMTISIFCAVLVFTGTTRWLQKMVFPSEEQIGLTCIAFYLLFICWFIALQLIVGYAAGVLCFTPADEDLDQELWVVEDNLRCIHQEIVPRQNIVFTSWGRGIAMGEDDYPVFLRERNLVMERVVRQTKCWGTIFGHTAGFAAIHAGVNLQHYDFFGQNVGTCLLAILVHQLLLFGLFRVLELVKCSSKPDKLVERYLDQVDDAENDVTALSMSFLIVQCIKFALTGEPSNAEGYQPANSIPTEWYRGPGALGLTGILFLALSIVLIRFWKEKDDEHPLVTRTREVLQSMTSMCFSWCILFATRWLTARLATDGTLSLKPGSMLATVADAVILSGMAFLVTVLLDKVEDSMAPSITQEKVFRNTITAIGLVVGLSWEHCFDRAVEVTASKTSHPTIAGLVVTLAVVVLIVPAWRRYILAKEIYYDNLKEEKRSKSFMHKGASQLMQQLKPDGRGCWFG